MSSPLRPALANLFLVHHECKWLECCPIQYRRYVDDIFLRFEREDYLKKFLRYTNSRHRNIQFTCEEKSDDKISFLDTP